VVHCDDLRLDSQNCKVYPRGTVVAKEVAIEWSRLIKRNKKTLHRANIQWKPPPPTLPSAKVYTSSVEWHEQESDVYMRKLMEKYGQGDVTFGPVNRFWKAQKRSDREKNDELAETYDFSMITPINENPLPFAKVALKAECYLDTAETILFKKRPPKKKKGDSVMSVDHDVVVVQPRDPLPSVAQFTKSHRPGRLYGVVDEKHLLLYRIAPFELLDLGP